jgi:type II secretory pathway component PulF
MLAYGALWGGTLLFLVSIFQGIFVVLRAALRKQERARLFLDLLETGAQQGRSFEHTIVGSANTRDPSLGILFHLVAAYLEAGHRLPSALAQVPGFLPRRLHALFQASQELGDLRKVIPLSRQMLQDGSSTAQAGQNSVGVVLFALPVWSYLILFLSIYIFPRLKEIARDMLGYSPPGFEHAMQWSIWLGLVSAGIWFLFALAVCLRGGGSRFIAWFENLCWPIFHGLELLLPWQRKRLQRDFSAMLAIYLDAGLPEAKALQLAAEGTGNRFFLRRTQKALAELRAGVRLTEAMQQLDDTGEFRWRLENTAPARQGFAAALAGWQDSLDAKAYAQEQAATQLVTTAVVFLNGSIVMLLAWGFMQIFITILEGCLLW